MVLRLFRLLFACGAHQRYILQGGAGEAQASLTLRPRVFSCSSDERCGGRRWGQHAVPLGSTRCRHFVAVLVVDGGLVVGKPWLVLMLLVWLMGMSRLGPPEKNPVDGRAVFEERCKQVCALQALTEPATPIHVGDNRQQVV